MKTDELKQAFSEGLGMDTSKITDRLAYGNPGWDSVAHMALVAAIERKFDIMLDTADVIDMSSFGKAKELLGKYGIVFEPEG